MKISNAPHLRDGANETLGTLPVADISTASPEGLFPNSTQLF